MRQQRPMSRTTASAICLGILLLLMAGVAGNRCGDGLRQQAPVVITDTVKVLPDSTATKTPGAKKAKKKKPAPASAPPRQRSYRDETVS